MPVESDPLFRTSYLIGDLNLDCVTPEIISLRFLDLTWVAAYQLASIKGPGNWLLMSRTSFWYPSGAAVPLEMVKS